MRRALLLLVTAVLGVDVLVVSGEIGPNARGAAAAIAPAVTTTTSTSSTTTTTTAPPPTTTTTTVPPPPPSAFPIVAPLPARVVPIDVPADPYAPEEIRVIGSIEIPKLGLRVPMHQGVTLNNIDHGPSHWPGSALPGDTGNVVVMGHRVTKTRPFRDIHTLVPGDEVLFEVGGERTRYVMTHHEVVTPDRTDIASQTSEPIATLFACHPPGSARYRYVVRLKLA